VRTIPSLDATTLLQGTARPVSLGKRVVGGAVVGVGVVIAGRTDVVVVARGRVVGVDVGTDVGLRSTPLSVARTMSVSAGVLPRIP